VEEIRNLILQNKSQVLAIEGKIADFMAIDLHRAIQGAVGKGKKYNMFDDHQ
jgi:hypothetical protein